MSTTNINPSQSPDLLNLTTNDDPDCEKAIAGSLVASVVPVPVLDAKDIEYPEGGLQAWLVVFGSFCGLMASLGIYNSSGVFSAVLAQIILPETAPSTLGWIFSIYAFVIWVCGVQIGPTFDVMGPRWLIVAGSVCTLVGIFTFSVSTEYYQILLSFSLLTGVGTSLLFIPCLSCVAHWFLRRRGLANGIIFIGSGAGGVLFPLMIQALIPQIGWASSIRVLGGVLFVLCAISIAFCRSRIPPRKGNAVSWKDTLPDIQIFFDGTGAMALTTLGVLLVDLAYFIPVTYVPSYYLARQNLSSEEALTGTAAFGYQLLAILNAASCFGRVVAGHFGDTLGPYNVMIISLIGCVTSVLALWLPDILDSDLLNNALLIVFVAFFGFVSGANVSLTPNCLSQLCDVRDYGRYYASCYTIVAFGCLVSIPIAGALLSAVHTSGREMYWGVALFTGLTYVASLACFVWVRVAVKGWNWRTLW